MPPTLTHKGSTRKNPVYRRMFRNAFRSFMILHILLWVYCLVTTWVNYAGWIQSINCPFPNYFIQLSDFILYTQSDIYLSYLTIPILWSAVMPFVLWITWMNYRWLDVPNRKRSSECWAWFMALAKAKHFEMTAVTLLLLCCEIALIFAGLFSNKMIHFPPLGQGVFATRNQTSIDNLVELPGVIAQYRIGPRLDEVIAYGSFAGNTEFQLPPGPWIISSYWRMTQSCKDAIESAIPDFSKGVRWSSMAAIMMLLGITLAFDIARLVASRAAGEANEIDKDMRDYCAGGCCGGDSSKSYDEEDDEGCMREFCGADDEGNGPCASCCQSDDESEQGSESGSESDDESVEQFDDDDDEKGAAESKDPADAPEAKSSGEEKEASEDKVVVDVSDEGSDSDKDKKRSRRNVGKSKRDVGSSSRRMQTSASKRDVRSSSHKKSRSKSRRKSSRTLIIE